MTTARPAARQSPGAAHGQATGEATGQATGHGSAYGAVTVLNATATGIGCSLAVGTPGPTMQATWTPRPSGLALTGAPDDRLARAMLGVLRRRHGGPAGARIEMQGRFPAARGLKTSSAAAAAMARAALAATRPSSGRTVGDSAAVRDGVRDADDGPADEVLDLAVEASIQAGVTLTGAYDDQLAVTLGGCRLSDNLARRDLGRLPVPGRHVAVWVPERGIDKRALVGLELDDVVAEARAAERLARAGRVPEAMTRNGAAFHSLYHDAGLPVTDAPVHIALDHGALGAGLSGTGPAVAAVFEAPADLPGVPGGQWTWTEAVHG